MRLAVSEQGYASAVAALVSGNELAARTATQLAHRLHGYAGMAGDDSTASDFAASYDDAAAASVAALASVVGAVGALGRLVEASLTNHAHAEARSALPGWARAVSGPPTITDRIVGVRLAPPPSCLGAHDHGPGGAAGIVLDLLQDVFWPNADTRRLHAAGDAWQAAATRVALLTAHCDTALAALDGERSPEVPLAQTVIGDIGERAGRLSEQYAALASACHDYAAHVETKRHELRSLLEDLVEEFAIGALVAGGLSFISGGAATGVAGSAGAARIASASKKARDILAGLRVLASGTAVETRTVAVTAGELTAYTERINGARVMLMEAGEQGAAASTPLSRLAASEGAGRGHTLERHVAKSVAYLRERVARHPTAMHASSFRSDAKAEEVIDQILGKNAGRVDDWLRDGSAQLRIDDALDEVTGISVNRAGDVAEVRGVRMILVRDPEMPDGYSIKTAFPQP
jgi:CDI toxin RNase A-like protein